MADSERSTRSRLKAHLKELDKLNKSADKLRLQLDNAEFTSKAPAQLIEKQKAQLEQTNREINQITTKLSGL